MPADQECSLFGSHVHHTLNSLNHLLIFRVYHRHCYHSCRSNWSNNHLWSNFQNCIVYCDAGSRSSRPRKTQVKLSTTGDSSLVPSANPPPHGLRATKLGQIFYLGRFQENRYSNNVSAQLAVMMQRIVKTGTTNRDAQYHKLPKFPILFPAKELSRRTDFQSVRKKT